MEILGVPTDEFLEKCPRKKYFFDGNNKPKIIPNSRGKIRTPGSRDVNYFIRCSDDSFLDLIRKCFVWEGEKRITAVEALIHDWILEGLP